MKINPIERRMLLVCAILLLAASDLARAETAFFEAEKFVPSSAGWRAYSNDLTRLVSRSAVLYGAEGPGDATADQTVTVAEAGRHRIWVRYFNMESFRGPFRLAVLSGGNEIAAQTFDLEQNPNTPGRQYAWAFLEADLPAGPMVLRLALPKLESTDFLKLYY